MQYNKEKLCKSLTLLSKNVEIKIIFNDLDLVRSKIFQETTILMQILAKF
jgi:hypothetical protein